MITEKKRTPITYFGKDGWEILVEDDYPYNDDVCELCMWREWNDWEFGAEPCYWVHGCSLDQHMYFIFQES